MAVEVLLPGFVARALSTRVGEVVTLHTLCYFESQGQGASFEPRLIGFLSPRDRRFFDLFTTVKGIGNRKALRALAEPPASVADAIARRDARALTALPEIGKRLAETMIAELTGKVEPFLGAAGEGGFATGRGTITPARPDRSADLPPPVADAIDALCALGESRADAERKVQRVLERASSESSGGVVTADTLLAAVYAGR